MKMPVLSKRTFILFAIPGLIYACAQTSDIDLNASPEVQKAEMTAESVLDTSGLDTITIYQTSTRGLESNEFPAEVLYMTNLKELGIWGMDCDYGDDKTCWMIRDI